MLGGNGKGFRSAKEIAYIAVFVALTVGSQLVLAAVPGVEVVTLLFVSYAFTFGVLRGTLAATAFSFLRCFVFGFDVKTIVLYLIYFNALAALFGALKKPLGETPSKKWWLIAPIAGVCTAAFTMLDNALTVIWFAYSAKAARLYFLGSLSFMIPQIVCTLASVGVLFFPLVKAFGAVRKSLYRS